MYCTVDDIINASKSYSFFNQHKLPDRDVLTNIGETVAKELSGYLYLYGYPLPLDETSTLYGFVSSLNVLGVLAQIMAKMVPMDAKADKNVAEERFLNGVKLLRDRRYINYNANFTWEEDDNVW